MNDKEQRFQQGIREDMIRLEIAGNRYAWHAQHCPPPGIDTATWRTVTKHVRGCPLIGSEIVTDDPGPIGTEPAPGSTLSFGWRWPWQKK